MLIYCFSHFFCVKPQIFLFTHHTTTNSFKVFGFAFLPIIMTFPASPVYLILWQHNIRRWLVKYFLKIILEDQEVNCHNSRTSDDINTKLGPVTKLDKRNKIASNKFDDDIMSENCDVIVIFSIYGQFGAIRKPDSGSRPCKTCFH